LFALQCPCECPGLSDVYGDEFEALYTKYEKEGKARRTIKVRVLACAAYWSHISPCVFATLTALCERGALTRVDHGLLNVKESPFYIHHDTLLT
jgi:hypothetical protein